MNEHKNYVNMCFKYKCNNFKGRYLCLIEMFNTAHSWPGTSVPVRPVWHTGAQNRTLYYKYIYIKFRLFFKISG